MQLPSDIFSTVTIKRRAVGTYTNGRWVDGAESTVTITASVQPASSTTLHPEEGDRAKDSIVVYSQSPIYALDESTGQQPDRIYWEGKYYRVQDVDYHKLTPELTHYQANAQMEQST